MLLQLKNGRTVNISVERYLSMSDDELDLLEINFSGMEISDPFFESVVESRGTTREEIIILQEEDIIPLEDYRLPDDVEDEGNI